MTRKIVAGACAIKRGEDEALQLGNIEHRRDWGSAPEYVDAMWRMMQLDQPTDLVIATGRTHSLAEFVARRIRGGRHSTGAHMLMSTTASAAPSDISV